MHAAPLKKELYTLTISDVYCRCYSFCEN